MLIRTTHTAVPNYKKSVTTKYLHQGITRFRAFNGAVFSYGAVRSGAVLPNRTAPHNFAFNKTAPNHRTAVYRSIETKNPHRTAPYDSKTKIRTEPLSGLGVFKIKYFATVRVRCGAVVTVFIEPHRTV